LTIKFRLAPSNIDLQLKLEEIAAKKMQFTNQMCEHMLLIRDELDENQSRIYQLTCIGPKFDNEYEQG
jgi:hypothetical protein